MGVIMNYNFNGKSITISDTEIKQLMDGLKITKQEAIELWLSDNGYEVNEEQQKLDETASKVHINKDIIQQKPKKERKKPEIKVSDEKKEIFNVILNNLRDIYDRPNEKVEILNENKLISCEINGIKFKIDIIQCRQSKN
jgi:hypothetical protein